MKTEVTQLPYFVNGSSGNGSTSGGGNRSGSGGNSSGERSLNPGIIAAIVISAVLASAMVLFFLRKRVKKRRAAQQMRWLSGGEKGSRTTLRSSFGDLRASTFGDHSDGGCDGSNTKRHSGPFSDRMTVPPPTPASTDSPARQMTQVARPEIIPPATAVHSTGRRNNRNSEFSIGSLESGGTDSGDTQWVHIHPNLRSGNVSPTDRFYLPSPISVRPFSPTESWSFPKPPNSRVGSSVFDRESKAFLGPDPFADPVSRPSSLGFSPVELVIRTFEPEAADELAVEIGDEVSVLRLFDDGWGKIKVLKRNGSAEAVQGLEGLIPIDCLRSKGKGNSMPVGLNS